jgi:hypothetical protein
MSTWDIRVAEAAVPSSGPTATPQRAAVVDEQYERPSGVAEDGGLL